MLFCKIYIYSFNRKLGQLKANILKRFIKTFRELQTTPCPHCANNLYLENTMLLLYNYMNL